MNNVFEHRAEFGDQLKQLRHEANHSLRGLGELSGVAYSMISAFELGEKAMGSETSVRLADALHLTGEQRENFLMKAAGTRKKDRLVGYARTLAPEILNYVAKSLLNAGIDLNQIKACKYLRSEAEGCDVLALELSDGRKLSCSLVLA
jgi:transcriptional regulator with XRE-family HTH domain